MSTLEVCHPSSVCWHHNGIQSAHKIMHCGYYWPTIYQYSHDFAMFCDGCKKQGGILKLQELTMNPILVIELFDVWGLEIMGPFVISYRMKYILVVVDYLSKLM